MKIVADENIALAREAFSPFGSVELYPGRNISNKILRDADALVVRSVTRINEELLHGTAVKFVGTATIGWDHLDTLYLDRIGVKFATAAGCNSDAVAEYVTSAIYDIAVKYSLQLKNLRIGIVGAGNIGTRVARIAAASGMEVLLNDPPLADQTGSSKYIPLSALMDCDIITMHVPLNLSGPYKTVHLFNEKNLSLLKENTIFLNTSRGPAANNTALLTAARAKNLITVLDVWENEPAISTELLAVSEIGTPHIAGYSHEGKINGTVMMYEALCRFAGFDPGWKYNPADSQKKIIDLERTGTTEQKINSLLKNIHDLREDDSGLREVLRMEDSRIPAYFDQLRKNYKLRREFFNFSIKADKPDPEVISSLEGMRFSL